MAKKQGQVTIFVIISLLVVAGIILFFSFRDKIQLKSSIPLEIEPINTFVQDCLKVTGENALVEIGAQGGYFFIGSEIDSVERRIPYYLQEVNKKIPTDLEIEQNLGGFVYEELSLCILNFKDFEDKFEIKHELKDVNVDILDNFVKFSLNYPLAVSKQKDKAVYSLENFEIELPIRVGIINKVSEEVIKEPSLHPESICLSCLYDIGKKYNVHIDMLDYGNSTIFTIIDDNSKIDEQSYEWSFAIK